MASYAPHYTSRLRIKYLGSGRPHNMLFRFPGPSDGSGLTEALTVIGAFLDALAPLMYDDFTVISVSIANIDTNIFLPYATTLTPTGSIAASTRTPAEEATAWTFVARTTGGNPWKFSLFGLYQNGIEGGPGQNYRVVFGENGDMDAALAVLNGGGTALIGNDGLPTHWAPYADYKDNDHYVKKVRG